MRVEHSLHLSPPSGEFLSPSELRRRNALQRPIEEIERHHQVLLVSVHPVRTHMGLLKGNAHAIAQGLRLRIVDHLLVQRGQALDGSGIVRGLQLGLGIAPQRALVGLGLGLGLGLGCLGRNHARHAQPPEEHERAHPAALSPSSHPTDDSAHDRVPSSRRFILARWGPASPGRGVTTA